MCLVNSIDFTGDIQWETYRPDSRTRFEVQSGPGGSRLLLELSAPLLRSSILFDVIDGNGYGGQWIVSTMEID